MQLIIKPFRRKTVIERFDSQRSQNRLRCCGQPNSAEFPRIAEDQPSAIRKGQPETIMLADFRTGTIRHLEVAAHPQMNQQSFGRNGNQNKLPAARYVPDCFPGEPFEEPFRRIRTRQCPVPK